MDSGEFTRVLQLASNGDGDAVDRLFVTLYDELRSMARQKLAKERSDHTLQATALVHEAYVRLVDQHGVQWKNRAHFFAVAARVMRQILVDHARRRSAKKRAGDKQRVSLNEALTVSVGNPSPDLIALDAALTRLQETEPEKAQVVEMRFFAGMTQDEVAEVLGVTPRTVRRYWVYAQARLYKDMSSGPDS